MTVAAVWRIRCVTSILIGKVRVIQKIHVAEFLES